MALCFFSALSTSVPSLEFLTRSCSSWFSDLCHRAGQCCSAIIQSRTLLLRLRVCALEGKQETQSLAKSKSQVPFVLFCSFCHSLCVQKQQGKHSWSVTPGKCPSCKGFGYFVSRISFQQSGKIWFVRKSYKNFKVSRLSKTQHTERPSLKHACGKKHEWKKADRGISFIVWRGGYIQNTQ